MSKIIRPQLSVCPKRLVQNYRYEPETGKIYWRRGDQIGDEAFTTTHHSGHLVGRALGVWCLAHRVAWCLYYGAWPSQEVNHINGNKKDNKINNLRDVSSVDVSRNMKRPSSNSSGHIGVSFHKGTQKWQAYIRVDGKLKMLGVHDDLMDAVNARVKAEERYGFHKNHGRNVLGT